MITHHAESIWDLPTPFLTIDLDAVERNIARMQCYCDAHELALRPHVKTHKMPVIAQLQLQAGARGITCQKLGEAELMADHGFDDILITFPLVGTGKAERLAELAGRVKIAVAADSAVVACLRCRAQTHHRRPESLRRRNRRQPVADPPSLGDRNLYVRE